MTLDCPSCRSSHTRVIETRPLHNGGRRRRHHCHDCRYRWTVWDGDRPRPGRLPFARGGNGGNKPPLTEDEVRLVLTSRISANKLAPQIGRSKEAIAAIRRGELHRKTCPEIPRWKVKRRVGNGLSCLDCRQWRDGSCRLGFPDPVDEGPAFAADCNFYEVSQSMSRA